MMKLLSMLVCLAVLLSGFAFAEAPATADAAVITIRDAEVHIQDQVITLNPTLSFGVASDETSALFDFGMQLGEKVLFPVQAKVDENGAALLLGSSTTAYTFSPEFFASAMADAEIPEELITVGEAYGNLLKAMLSLEPTASAEINEEINKQIAEYATITEKDDAVFSIDGEELTGTQYILEMDADQMYAFIDFCYSMLPAEFSEAYFGFINATQSLTGGPEIHSFGELLDYAGIDMSLSADITGNDTSAAGTMTFRILADPSAMAVDMTVCEATEETAEEPAEAAESDDMSVGIIGGADGPTSIMVTGVSATPVSMEIPMSITVYSPENVLVESTMDIEGVAMNVTAEQHDGTSAFCISYDIPDLGSIVIDAAQQPQDDGSVFNSASLNADFGANCLSLMCENTCEGENSVTYISLDYADETFTGGASFTVEKAPGTIEDRISAAMPKIIFTVDELENHSAGLTMAAAGLLGDVEPLLNDESVIALIEAVEEMFGLTEAEPVAAPEVNMAENEEPYVALPEPALNWIPEGYSIAEATFEQDFNYYSFTLLPADEDYEAAIYVSVYSNEASGEETSYFILGENETTEANGSLVSVSVSDDGDFYYRSAYAYFDDYIVDVVTYIDEPPAADLVNLIAGISFAE